MNFIKDQGGYAFVNRIQKKPEIGIWKIILLDNECTEAFKKKVKKLEKIVI